MTTFESTICYHVRYDAPGRTRILVDDYGDYGNPHRDRFRRLAAHAETAAGEQGWRSAGASRSPGWGCPGCITWLYGEDYDYYEHGGLKARPHGMLRRAGLLCAHTYLE